MGGAKYRILVVDNEPDVVESTTANILRIAQANRDHVELFRAFDVSGADAILSNNPIDVIVADYHFPSGASGDELIDKINDPFGSKLIILMSDRDEHRLAGVIRKRHANLGDRFRFLRKPFDEMEVQAKYLEIAEFFSKRPYPFPIEYAKQLLLTRSNGQGQIGAIKDLLESFLKYCVAIMMSDLARRGGVKTLKLRIQLLRELTMGAWLQWFESALRSLSQAPGIDYMPELSQMFVNENNGFITMFYQFLTYRNEGPGGHGFSAEEDKYSSDVRKYRPKVDAFLQSLLFLSRYVVFAPLRSDFASDGSNDFVYDVKVLMGADAVPRQVRLQSPERLRLNESAVYIYSPNQTCLLVSPFLTYQLCDTCGGSKLYLFDRVLGSELIINSTCNHRKRDKRAKIEFDNRFGSLLS